MSDLTGHAKITRVAVMEFSASQRAEPLAGVLNAAGLPDAVVSRDLLDVLTGGHWADFGQKHHFMRRFDGQSPYEAWEDAVEWIRSNAFISAQQLASLLTLPALSRGRQRPACGRCVSLTFQNVSWQPLGYALHALEDSFAAGHVRRATADGDMQPGDIEHIKRYAGAEKEHHAEDDEAWWDKKANGFSLSGRLAKNAVKALLDIVLETALADKHPSALRGWVGFRNTWLKPSPKLSRARDRIFELIDQFYVGIRIGATNVKTINFDEEGLAKALLKEDSQTVLQVFVRLDEEYNSDSDDVAELYVNYVRQAGGALENSLKANRPLITRLIKVMQEGWTSDGEQACIDYLKSL